MLLKIVISFLDHRRAQLSSLELVDGCKQERAFGGELLRAVGPAARICDGGHVVRSKVALDELLCRIYDDLRAQWCNVEVVEHDHIQATADGLGVRFDVAQRWRRCARK